MKKLPHFNEQGRAKMVDITNKDKSFRKAIAQSTVIVSAQVYQHIVENKLQKGDVLAVAQVAGIMAAKNTANWIPMCHPLPLSGVDIAFEWQKHEENYKLIIEVTVKTYGATGVEMEALTAASATALTVYDMCKSICKEMIISSTYLLAKSGGKSGDYERK